METVQINTILVGNNIGGLKRYLIVQEYNVAIFCANKNCGLCVNTGWFKIVLVIYGIGRKLYRSYGKCPGGERGEAPAAAGGWLCGGAYPHRAHDRVPVHGVGAQATPILACDVEHAVSQQRHDIYWRVPSYDYLFILCCRTM